MCETARLDLKEIGIEGSYTILELSRIDEKDISSYDRKQKCLLNKQQQIRTPLTFETQVDHGSYGNIVLAKRGTHEVLVKQPRMAEMNLLQEAILQHLAFKALDYEGFSSSIPRVYDVFQNQKQICFTMEYIRGFSIVEWFEKSLHPDMDTFFLLSQLCLILSSLEKHLNLDHRDLKCSNLLIKKTPNVMRLKLGEHIWSLHSPFTVVVLDFGFACLGSQPLRGKPIVNLGDGVLPPMDPCPKEGRDIFHLLVSLLGLPIFRERISKTLHEKIDGWLSVGNKSYGSMARRWSSENWSYLVSSQPQFSIEKCCPTHILHDVLPELRGYLLRS